MKTAAGFAVLKIGTPVPGLSEQFEGAVATHHIAARGAHEENLLVPWDILPAAAEGDIAGWIGGRAGRGVRVQSSLQQIGIIAFDIDRFAVATARGGVLGSRGAVVEA